MLSNDNMSANNKSGIASINANRSGTSIRKKPRWLKTTTNAIADGAADGTSLEASVADSAAETKEQVSNLRRRRPYKKRQVKKAKSVAVGGKKKKTIGSVSKKRATKKLTSSKTGKRRGRQPKK